MSVFAVVNDEGYVLRVFSAAVAAEAFLSRVQELDAIHAEWVFSPKAGQFDFVAPEGFEGLEDFIGVDAYAVEEFQVH